VKIAFTSRPLPSLGLLTLLLGQACKPADSVADVLLVASVEVSPPSATLSPQETLQLEATPRTEGGLILPSRDVVWASSTPNVVSVSETGLVRALAVGGPVTLTATVEGVQGSAAITVVPVAVDHVTVSPGEANVVVGASSQLTATAFAAGGGVLTGRAFMWESSAPAIAQVTNSGLVIGQAEGGPVTITASTGGKSATASVTVTRRPATRLGFAQQPGPAVAGQPLVPAVRVAIQDDLLGTVSNATNQVNIALAGNPGNATLSGTTTVSAVNGIATFSNLSLDRVGNGYTLIATSSGLTSITSTPFDVTAGSANRLGFTTAPPATARSGVALSPQPVLQLRDGAGNPVSQAGIVVTASIASGNGTLSGTTTATTSSSGSAAFGTLALNGPTGSYTIAFSAPGIQAITSGPIVLSAGLPALLTIETQPSSSAQSGVPLAQQPALQARDQAGNAVRQAGIAITASIASGPAGGSLGGATVVVTDANGLASFGNLSLSGSAGSYTLGFNGAGMTGTASSPIVLGAGGGTNLAVTTQPSTTVASGAVFPRQPVIQLRDAANNPVAQAGVLVTASIQTGGGTLGGTATVATSSSGAASFSNLSISGAVGDRTLLFAAPGYVSVSSGSITLTAGPATQLSISTQPSSSAQSGVAFAQQPVILVRDASNNPVGGVVVSAAIASGGGTLGGTASATSGSNGLASFTNLSISGTAGSRTLSFAATGLAPVVSAAISVTSPPTQLSITTQPSSTAQAGVAFAQQPVILVRDAANNPVSGIVVTAAIASGGGTLSGTATATSSASGSAAFTNLSISGTVGARTLSFSATGVPSVASGNINLTAGPASQLSITTQPSSSATSGTAFPRQPVLLVKDASDNPVSGVVVTASIASGGGTLGGTLTATSSASGVASFSNLSISGSAGDRTLGFSAPGIAAGVTSDPISVTIPPSQLSITTQPSGSVQSGVAFPTQPVILVKDASNNPLGGIVVTAAISSGGGTLGGTLTATSNASGLASFTDLSISGTTGKRKLVFSAAPAPSVTSNDITVNPGPASQLTITTQPGSPAVVNTNLSPQPVIQLRDAAGNAVSQSGVSVTAAIETGPVGGSLGGSLTVTTNGSGVATFTNLKLTKSGSYTLRFSATGLTSVVSATINVI
jgi:Big-like domain-containing protein